MRATWLNLDCEKKTFNVSGDGYAWQNIYKDQYGQAEDLYYQFCVVPEGQTKPRYLTLAPADPDMLRSAQVPVVSASGQLVVTRSPGAHRPGDFVGDAWRCL